MTLLNIFDATLPLQDPILKFLVVLIIILFAPIILNKLKIPYLLGLIIAGAIVGPNGFHVLDRDASIVVTGVTGLLYIMFLAGLEMDMNDFKRNRKISLALGLYTFIIPVIGGFLASYYVLNFPLLSSILLASLFASHTLIAYPLVSKMGVAKNTAVNVAVGGTIITDTLSLTVLAVVVGMTKGNVDAAFWLRLAVSMLIFGAVVLLIFPIIGRWFFKKVEDRVLKYIFVLLMLYLGAVLAELAGIEAIVGAFLTGLSLNRLIPHNSPLMNRVEFVGNAYFIPFFLISVGMLIDFKTFFRDTETIKVAVVMTAVALLTKYLSAWATQKTFGFSKDQRSLIYGLIVSKVAATLAAVLVGYNIVLYENEAGEPVRLLNESVLNGTILMILVTCTVASFAAQKGAKKIAEAEMDAANDGDDLDERILMAINYPETTEELVNLGMTVKSKSNKDGIYALHVIDNTAETNDRSARKIMEVVNHTASSTDFHINNLIRYDENAANGIIGEIKQHKITDLILNLHQEKGMSDSFLGNLTEGILQKTKVTTLIYKSVQPLSTIRKHVVVVPENAEKEPGFPFWLIRIWNIVRNTGTKVVFYATPKTIEYIKTISSNYPLESSFAPFENWDEFLIFTKETINNTNLILVMSRRNQTSFNRKMDEIPALLNKYFKNVSFLLIYPIQPDEVNELNDIDMKNPSMWEPINEISNTISRLFKSYKGDK